MKPGRNDDCPCGSGKKYKKCCLVADNQSLAGDLEYSRLRKIEASLIPRLLSHAFEAFGESAMHDAWIEFHDGLEDEEPTSDNPMNMVFMPWFFFNWLVEHEDDRPAEHTPLFTTVAEDFLNTHGKHLSDDEKAIIAAASRRPFSLCEVIEVKPGIGLVLFDMFQKKQFEVIEKTASKSLSRGDFLLCATMLPLAGKLMNIATAPYTLPPTAKLEILELRKDILKRCRRKNFSEKMLRDEEPFVIGFYLDSIASMFNPQRELVNTDGEELIFHTLIFDLTCSPEDAFEALKDLAHHEPDDDFLEDAKRDASGRLKGIQFPWLSRDTNPKRSLSAPLVLGDVEINGSRLTVRVNSKERADRARKEIESRLNKHALYRTTLIESLEKMLQEREGKATPSPKKPTPRNQLPPEALEKMAELNREYWSKWFDIPVPALNNMTPRDAAKTEEGRDLLSSLLLYYEQQNEKSKDNLLRVDVEMLKRELGLPNP